jgi:glucose-fructose oxidoreductase
LVYGAVLANPGADAIEGMTMPRSRKKPEDTRAIRYAVVGLGYITQVAVLPAFAHARRNSVLAALISDDEKKMKTLARKYRVAHTGSYDEYEDCLRRAAVDAVYIALPNHMHREYTERAAAAGVHILCEKPMALSVADGEAMINAARAARRKLMIAYRLHFEAANLRAVEIAQSGKLGDLRSFSSTFTMQVKDWGNIRLRHETGGGPVWDLGVYCVNAARYLFRDEPTHVWATAANSGDPRFSEIEEMATAVLRFPNERLASFTCSFGAADVSACRLVGTKGHLRLDPAYEYAEALVLELTVNGRQTRRTFPKRDQFAPELLYFSDCVLQDREPEPSGSEGLADVRVIEAVYRSIASGEVVTLPPMEKHERPSMRQEIRRPPVSRPSLVRARAPSEG